MMILSKRRKAEGKTNYTKRRKLLEGGKPRIIIRKSNKQIIIQYVESKCAQDKVKVSTVSNELLNYGWPKEQAGSLKSLPAAYLAGLLFGKKALNMKLTSAILDTGLIRSTKGSRIYSAVKGIVDSGFNLPHNTEVFPEDSRIENENVKAFFNKVKESLGNKVEKKNNKSEQKTEAKKVKKEVKK